MDGQIARLVHLLAVALYLPAPFLVFVMLADWGTKQSPPPHPLEANKVRCFQAMHALLEDIHVDFKFSTWEQSGSFAIYSMQIDNQLLTSSRPVVLSHDAPAPVSPPLLLGPPLVIQATAILFLVALKVAWVFISAPHFMEISMREGGGAWFAGTWHEN